MCLCVCVGGAGAGLTDGPIQRVGGGPRAREGGGPIPGIEAAAVDPGGHPLLASNNLALFFWKPNTNWAVLLCSGTGGRRRSRKKGQRRLRRATAVPGGLVASPGERPLQDVVWE